MVTFVIGGMTGVLMAVPPTNFQLHTSLFLIAHFHNVIIGGAVRRDGGYSYWFPKAFAFRLDKRWGKASFLIDAAGSTSGAALSQVLRLIATLPPGRPAPQSDLVRYQVTRAPSSLCGQTRGAVVKIFLLGATG